MARAQGRPFVYISANSGAHIGLAEEVKLHFKVAWPGMILASQRRSGQCFGHFSVLVTLSVELVPLSNYSGCEIIIG